MKIDSILKRFIENGGGKFVGRMDKLVLFNSPTTGSTLALPIRMLTVDKVKTAIAESNALFTTMKW